MREDRFEFEDDTYIDLNRLEWECARQGKLFAKWGKRWARAVLQKKKAEERVKTKRSNFLKDVLSDWKELGYSKEPTGPQQEAYYRTDDEYKRLKTEAINADSEVNMLWIALRSLEHKRSMLGDEQKLYGNEYWSTPYEDPGFSMKVQEEMEEFLGDSLVDDDNRIGKILVRR
jgi:hypothetical protein